MSSPIALFSLLAFDTNGDKAEWRLGQVTLSGSRKSDPCAPFPLMGSLLILTLPGFLY